MKTLNFLLLLLMVGVLVGCNSPTDSDLSSAVQNMYIQAPRLLTETSSAQLIQLQVLRKSKYNNDGLYQISANMTFENLNRKTGQKNIFTQKKITFFVKQDLSGTWKILTPWRASNI